MTFEDLGALGDLISGFAVIASLIYLAAQIRQNTAMITAQTVQAAVDATQRVLLYRVEDRNLRAILGKARANTQLNADELEVLVSYLQASFMNFQARLQHHARGVFDPSVNESYELILRDYLHQGYVRRWWTYAKALYGREFRNHCDEMIAEIERGGAVPVEDWQKLLQPPTEAPDR